MQGTRSVYRADLHAAFMGSDGQVAPGSRLATLLYELRIETLYMQSEAWQPQGGLGVPPLATQQLHFSAECNREEFRAVQSALSDCLSSFHRAVAQSLNIERK